MQIHSEECISDVLHLPGSCRAEVPYQRWPACKRQSADELQSVIVHKAAHHCPVVCLGSGLCPLPPCPACTFTCCLIMRASPNLLLIFMSSTLEVASVIRKAQLSASKVSSQCHGTGLHSPGRQKRAEEVLRQGRKSSGSSVQTLPTPCCSASVHSACTMPLCLGSFPC